MLQQIHLDVVEDVAAATAEVLRSGARTANGDAVFADPAGLPFCLVTRPCWADYIDEDGGVFVSDPGST